MRYRDGKLALKGSKVKKCLLLKSVWFLVLIPRYLYNCGHFNSKAFFAVVLKISLIF